MTQSLHGLRVLNTRPKDQAPALSQQIMEAGGVAIECPTLEIIPTNTNWVVSLPDLATVKVALFISANAVHHCFKALRLHQITWPLHIKLIAIGQATAAALAVYGLQGAEVPQHPDSDHLLKLKTVDQLKNKTVLLFKGQGGRQLIEMGLKERGAHVLPVIVYERVIPAIPRDNIELLWRQDLVDIVLLTSEQSMHNLFEMFGKEAHAWLKGKPCLVISDRLARCAKLSGMQNILICHPEQIMQTLFNYKD